MSAPFPYLFSPLDIGAMTVKNRMFLSGHQTLLVKNAVSGPDHTAYYEARAAGGVGLIIIEVATVHDSIVHFEGGTIDASKDACIAGYRLIADALAPYDCRAVAQLFHPGRQLYDSVDGSAPVAYAPSAVPDERFHIVPRPLSRPMIQSIVAGFGDAARRVEAGGIDGAEIVASHGYLPVQFLNPRLNLRNDEYGGNFDNRLRFLREVIADIRAKTGPAFTMGMRISGDDLSHDGLDLEAVTEICVTLDGDGALDYFHVTAGTASSLTGSTHIVPPMFHDTGYTAPLAEAVRTRVDRPVFVAGRINQPQIAEDILASGQADMCCVTRAMISDPEMPNKAKAGALDDIRACIACNQACIGHALRGFPISCIQHPESGRELAYGRREPAAAPRRVIVAGGGPGGMKAACVAAERGHRVTMFESANRLGGQVLLAQELPGRAEFGGLVTNFTRELERAGVEVVLEREVTRALINEEAPDAVILGTGGRARAASLESGEGAHVVDGWDVVAGRANVGQSVVIADSCADWIGLGLAEKLARDGCRVRLCVNGYMAGQMIQQYVRDMWLGKLNSLGVEIVPMSRLFGADGDSVYLQHTTSDEPLVYDDVDTLVLAAPAEPNSKLEATLEGIEAEVYVIGDCLAPRTAEEAVLEGLRAGIAV